MSRIPTARHLYASLLLFALHHHTGATPVADGEVVLHVQILKEGTLVEDATLAAQQGATASRCFGTELDSSLPIQGSRRIGCDGLRLVFSPGELRPEAVHASLSVEYYKRSAQANAASSRFEGFSISASLAMNNGTPIVAGDGPYSLRLYARY